MFCALKMVANLSKIYPKDMEAPAGGVDDMTKLSYLHEPGVLENLKTRYELNEIYVRSHSLFFESIRSHSLHFNRTAKFQCYIIQHWYHDRLILEISLLPLTHSKDCPISMIVT